MRKLTWVCFVVPSMSIVAVFSLFFVFKNVLPEQWVVHIDGLGNTTYGSWWLLIAIAAAVTAVAFLLGGYLAHDFIKLGHWYHNQKGIVMCCSALGYGVLGFFTTHVVVALSGADYTGGQTAVGYGLLAFVVIAGLAAVAYTLLLPRAQQQR